MFKNGCISILCSLIFLTSCKNHLPVKLIGEAQGTYYMISYYDESNRDFQYEIDSILDEYDTSVSLWVSESIINRVNNNDSSVVIDNYFRDNFIISKQVSIETDGAFDITIEPLVVAWGFGEGGVIDIDTININSILTYVGYDKINLINNRIKKSNPKVQIDFNAIAQGYSVDLILNYLLSKGIENLIVDIGGEVSARGSKLNGEPWKVGIEKPASKADDIRDLTAIIKLVNKSIATSGNYRKYIEKEGRRISHIINPKTGYPSEYNLLSATVIYDNAAFADAYATACMVLGLEKPISFVGAKKGLEAFLIYSTADGQYDSYYSEGFNNLIISNFQVPE